MDAFHFDCLTRALATALSRRGLTQALGGLLLAGPFTIGRNIADVEAKKKKRKKKKKCKGGKKKCGRKCFDLQTDPAHCGSCRTVCDDGQACLAGACACPNAQTECGGFCCAAASCIDDACCPTDRTCGTACCDADEICGDPETATCVAGQGTCPTGADTCGSGNLVSCNANAQCFCVQTTAGKTRCATPIPGISLDDCGDCTTDADCEVLFPDVVGVFCGKNASGPICGCPVGLNVCGAPCPTT